MPQSVRRHVARTRLHDSEIRCKKLQLPLCLCFTTITTTTTITSSSSPASYHIVRLFAQTTPSKHLQTSSYTLTDRALDSSESAIPLRADHPPAPHLITNLINAFIHPPHQLFALKPRPSFVPVSPYVRSRPLSLRRPAAWQSCLLTPGSAHKARCLASIQVVCKSVSRSITSARRVPAPVAICSCSIHSSTQVHKKSYESISYTPTSSTRDPALLSLAWSLVQSNQATSMIKKHLDLPRSRAVVQHTARASKRQA